MRIFLLFAAFVAMQLIFESPLAAAPRPQSILVLQQSDARGPFPVTILSALSSTVDRQSPHPVSIHVENLDLSRFGDQLPPGGEIRHRPDTLWDLYGWQIVIACAALLLLTILLAILLIYEHQNRLRAELAANQRMSELARINRQATAGEMSAAIAHELNQPLGAILNNAETAAIILNSASPDIDELKEILSDIRRDDQRAGDIIKRLRALVTKQKSDFHKLDLNRVTREALAVAGIQGHANGITIHDNLAQHRLIVAGDPIQLQQVVMNLAINGMEAIMESPNGRRDIVARTALAEDDQVEFSISDFGAGIPDDKMKHLFDPFFTTKQNGMGMGLSLARTIIEAHHGTIWAENRIAGGAIFRFRLPLASAS